MATYEGEYGDLLHFVHEIDKSPSLMIIESLSAAPQAGIEDAVDCVEAGYVRARGCGRCRRRWPWREESK